MSIEILERAQWDIEIAADELRQRAGVRMAEQFAIRLNRTLTLLERFPRLGQLIEPPYPNYPDLRVIAIRRQPHHLV